MGVGCHACNQLALRFSASAGTTPLLSAMICVLNLINWLDSCFMFDVGGLTQLSF